MSIAVGTCAQPRYDFVGDRMDTADEVAGLPPFTVKLDSVGDFYPESPIIYWRVALSDELTRVSPELHARSARRGIGLVRLRDDFA